METTAAILLRRIKLTESSLIVTWFTEEHGKLKTVAKGARRPRSPFAGRLDLFFAAEITYSRSRQSELHGLREVAVRDSREGLRTQYERTQMAAYFVELVEMTTEFEQPVPEVLRPVAARAGLPRQKRTDAPCDAPLRERTQPLAGRHRHA